MTRIYIRPFTPDIFEEAVRFTSVTAASYGRVKGTHLSIAELLNEAIRFYNYGIKATPQHAINKRDWLPIDEKTLTAATQDLHERLVDTTFSMTKRLAVWSQGKARHLPRHLKAQEKKLLADSAHATVLAADLFLSPVHRNTAYVKQLKQTKVPSNIWFREFEQLAAAVQGTQGGNGPQPLRSLLDRETIERQLLQQYGGELVSPRAREQFFLPQWGGNCIIQPTVIQRPGGRTQAWDPAAPFWPHKATESGPTEKLYFCLASNIFQTVHLQASRSPPSTIPATQCRWLGQLNESIKNIERILPLSLSGLRSWGHWLRNLEWLGYLFEQALAVRTDAWLEDELSQSTHRADNYAVGIHTGLVSGLALTGLLRGYLVDRIACTLMTCLPLVIDQVYRKVSGCFGVVLYEALWGREIPTLTETSCAQMVNANLVNTLGSWRILPLDNFWGAGASPVQQSLHQLYTHWLTAPLRYCSRSTGLTAAQQEVGVTASTYYRCFDRYPPILPAFYEALDLAERKSKNHYLYGARFTVQAQVFVAMQLMRKGLAQLGLAAGFDQSESKREAQDPRHRRYLKNLAINAGTYLWGGKKPPHNSHRDGACFDFGFGPVIAPWPASKLKAHIKNLAAVDPRFGQYMEQSEHGQPRKKLYDEPLVIGYSLADAEKSEDILFPRQLVFRRLLNRLLYDGWGKLGNYCDASLDAKNFEFTAAESQAYDDVEKLLNGTPDIWHQRNYQIRLRIPVQERAVLADWQRAHVAHLAILLSAPRRIIYASPLIHLRSMRAIRQGLQASADVTRLAAELVKGVYFTFLPQDHHHHWHVDYLPTTGCWRPRAKCGEHWLQHQRVERLRRFFPLWLALEVNLEPLLRYLRHYPGQGAWGEAMREAGEEYAALMQAMEEYQQAYLARYYPASNLNLDAMDEAATLLENIFSHFDKEGYYAKPHYGVGMFPCREITEITQRSGQFVQHFLNQVRTSPHADEIMLDLATYNLGDYLEIWGQQENVED